MIKSDAEQLSENKQDLIDNLRYEFDNLLYYASKGGSLDDVINNFKNQTSIILGREHKEGVLEQLEKIKYEIEKYIEDLEEVASKYQHQNTEWLVIEESDYESSC